MAHSMLYLLAIALGIQTGAGLFETRVLVPLWSSSPPESVIAYRRQAMRPDSGRRFWIYWTPLVGLISVVNGFFAWRSQGAQRSWWLLGTGASVAVILATFGYFVPVLLTLMREGELPPTGVTAKVRWWVRLNWVRAAVLVLAWLSILKALAGPI